MTTIKHYELKTITFLRENYIPRKPNGKPINNSTVWRWIRKGLQGLDGERIRLVVTYCGNTPYTTVDDIDDFFRAITEAKISQHQRSEDALEINTL